MMLIKKQRSKINRIEKDNISRGNKNVYIMKYVCQYIGICKRINNF